VSSVMTRNPMRDTTKNSSSDSDCRVASARMVPSIQATCAWMKRWRWYTHQSGNSGFVYLSKFDTPVSADIGMFLSLNLFLNHKDTLIELTASDTAVNEVPTRSRGIASHHGYSRWRADSRGLLPILRWNPGHPGDCSLAKRRLYTLLKWRPKRRIVVNSPAPTTDQTLPDGWRAQASRQIPTPEAMGLSADFPSVDAGGSNLCDPGTQLTVTESTQRPFTQPSFSGDSRRIFSRKSDSIPSMCSPFSAILIRNSVQFVW